MTESADGSSPRPLTNDELAAVAALWKRFGRQLVTRFRGTSMQPTIADGASVTLLCTNDVSIGDVVAYVSGERVIVHRIVAVLGGRFITRGDANLLPDPALLEHGAVIGKVVSVESARGWITPEALPNSPSASMLLRLCTAAARIGGEAVALRLVGLLRAAQRRLRRLRRSHAPEAEKSIVSLLEERVDERSDGRDRRAHQ